MKKEEIRSMWVAVILLAIILIMSIGFAAYTQTLTIGGTNDLTVKRAAWSVHWNTSYNTTGYNLSSGSQSIGTPNVTATGVTFTTTLNEIGEFAEFTVQAQNDGTIDAQLTDITISGLSAAQQAYTSVKVTYDGTDYTSSQTGLSTALNANDTKLVKIRVEYVEPATAGSLPTADQTITLTVSFDYTSV